MGGKIQRWRRSVDGDGGSGRQSTLTCIEVNGYIDQRIWDNRRISINELIYKMNSNHGNKWCKELLNAQQQIFYSNGITLYVAFGTPPLKTISLLQK
jgi:hypothetical protein